MKSMKSLMVATAFLGGAILAGCDAGGHGYEGKYSVEPTAAFNQKLKMFEGNDLTGPTAQQIRANLAAIDAEIGTDYAMFNGNRIEAERVFVREQEGKSYLVAITKDGEDVFPILDAEKKVLQIDADTKLVWESEL